MKKNIYKPMVLPSDDSELKLFVTNNKLKLMANVVDSIEHSLKNELSVAEIFRFKKSDFIITLDKNNFLSNIEQIYNYCLQNEHYEMCNKIKKLNVRFINKYEKK